MTGPGDDDLRVRASDDEPPPLLGSWPRVYVAVLCYLALVIFAFWLFEKAVSP